MAGHTLIVLRHAKSDQTADEGDLVRPLAKRGRRQGRESARWIVANIGHIDLAVVSPAVRAQRTWDLVVEEGLDNPPTAQIDDRIYGASADALVEVVQEFPESATTIVLVGHNPGLEELVPRLCSDWAPLPSSAIAVIDLPGAWRNAGDGSATLRTHGRPPGGDESESGDDEAD
jgi:phosphohistidine phosphatase